MVRAPGDVDSVRTAQKVSGEQKVHAVLGGFHPAPYKPDCLKQTAEALAEPMTLMPQKTELTTQQAAAFLNVSRPFVIKEIEAGRLACRLVNRHRRIEFEELLRYQGEQKQRSEAALKQLSELSKEMGEEL